MHVVSSMPLLNKKRMFRLKGATLECVSLESDLTIARFDMTECEVKTDKDTLVLQMPNAVPVILQPPADEYERWKHVLRQARQDAQGGGRSGQMKTEPSDRRGQIKSDDGTPSLPPPPPMSNAESLIAQHSWLADPPRAGGEAMVQQQTGAGGPMDAKQKALEHQRRAQEMAKKIAAERQQLQAKMGINPGAKPARRKYIAKKYIIAKQLREEMAREAKQKIVEQVQQDTEFRHNMLQQMQKDREELEKLTDEERKKRMALFQAAKEADEKAREAAAGRVGGMGPMGMMGPMGFGKGMMGPMGMMMGPMGFMPKPMAKPGAYVPRPPAPPLPWVHQVSKQELSPWTLVQRPVNDLLSRFPSVTPAPDLMGITCHCAGPELRGAVQLDPLVDTITPDPKREIPAPATPAVEAPTKGKKFIVKIALMTGKFLDLKTHPTNQIQFVLLNRPGQPDTLPEGVWTKKQDGSALKETAIRVVRDTFGVDISQCAIHRFMDFKYTTEAGQEIQSTIMVPELWKCASLPLSLGKLVREEEEDVHTTVSVEEPMSPADIEVQRKAWREKIDKLRAQGRLPRPGEREVERAERLEKMEDEIKNLEKTAPEVKETKTVTKQVTEKRKVMRDVGKPVLVSLHHMLEISQPHTETPFTNAVFEAKAFAHCFREMLKLEMGLKIIEWLPQYEARVKGDIEVLNKKRKRDQEQMQERDRINKERQAKRQKLGESRKPPAPKAAPLREADRLEQEQIESEKKKTPEEPAVEDKMEEVEPDLPPLKFSTFVYELDEAAAKPFTFFDTSTGQPSGNVDRVELLHVFHRTTPRCQREVAALVQASLLTPPGAHGVPENLFPYKSACSSQKEVNPAAPKEKPAGGQDTAGDTEMP
jgi:hypothetical protein